VPLAVDLEAAVSERYDAVVVGGGPAGSSTAVLLARAGWSVLVLERKPFPRRKVCGEYLSATNLPLFRRLGITDAFLESAGPDVRRVGLFAGEAVVSADLPVCREAGGWGRALGRESLDTLLLNRAAHAGADVRQPWSPTFLVREDGHWSGRAECKTTGATLDFSTPVVVAAHGSWEPGPLPNQPVKALPRPSDLLGFKAHFHNSDLAPGLMPLLSFPGGYGGMVHTDRGRVSISLCVRRDRLHALRSGNTAAGDDVEAFVRDACRGARQALAGAVRDGGWLSAGPLRPGIRLRQPAGLFPVGNAAGEAHPVIAEGISMALQASWLLARELHRWRSEGAGMAALPALQRSYGAEWRRHFAPRLGAAAVIAHWAMRRGAVRMSLPALRLFPSILTVGARVSGKVRRVC
jgi:flavin-dependent dehydrogenase